VRACVCVGSTLNVDQWLQGGLERFTVFCSVGCEDVTPCTLVEVCWRFGGTYRLYIQGRRIRQAKLRTKASGKQSCAIRRRRLYTECSRRKDQYSGRSRYRSFQAENMYMYMCPIPNGFRDRAISLYSSKIVDKKEILRIVSNTGIYCSSDKVGTVYIV
jgi:hypothetical protein